MEFPFCRDNSLFILIEALAVFSIFMNLHFHSSAINRMAGYVFPVYLYHSTIVLTWILPKLTGEYLVTTSGGSIGIMGLIIVGTVFSAILISAGIELLRRVLFSSMENRLIAFLVQKGNRMVQRFRTEPSR